MVRIGTAGWTLPKNVQTHFPGEGSHLARYARRFDAAEINSSFYRPHRPSTYTRWADSVPDGFRFCVKVPKAITHVQRLVGTEGALDAFLAESAALRDRRSCMLVQLPPSLAFEPAAAGAFLAALRSRYAGDAVLEPRHATWFEAAADALLVAHRIARVAADPARVPAAAEPGGWPQIAYWRLHGSPHMYRSSYGDAWLDALATRLRQAAAQAREVWCVFDNTTLGAAAANALSLQDRLSTAQALIRR